VESAICSNKTGRRPVRRPPRKTYSWIEQGGKKPGTRKCLDWVEGENRSKIQGLEKNFLWRREGKNRISAETKAGGSYRDRNEWGRSGGS